MSCCLSISSIAPRGTIFLPRPPFGAKSNTLTPASLSRLYTVGRAIRHRAAISGIVRKSLRTGGASAFTAPPCISAARAGSAARYTRNLSNTSCQFSSLHIHSSFPIYPLVQPPTVKCRGGKFKRQGGKTCQGSGIISFYLPIGFFRKISPVSWRPINAAGGEFFWTRARRAVSPSSASPEGRGDTPDGQRTRAQNSAIPRVRHGNIAVKVAHNLRAGAPETIGIGRV